MKSRDPPDKMLVKAELYFGNIMTMLFLIYIISGKPSKIINSSSGLYEIWHVLSRDTSDNN